MSFRENFLESYFIGYAPTGNKVIKNNYKFESKFLTYLSNCDSGSLRVMNCALHKFIKFSSENEADILKTAKDLFNYGVDINEQDYNEDSALILAIQKKMLSLTLFLIETGAQVNVMNSDGLFPLLIAIEDGNEKVLNALLSNGANINTKNSMTGGSALHEACFHHNESIMSYLLSYGADISAQDLDGKTPFSELDPSKENYVKCVTVMLKEFAKLKSENIVISSENLSLIEKSLTSKKIFLKCLAEIEKMKNTKFYSIFSYYYVLKRSEKIIKLSNLFKNKDFEAKFLRNLNNFPIYDSDLTRIHRIAVEVGLKSEILKSRLFLAFGPCLPDVVITEVAKNLTIDDISEQ